MPEHYLRQQALAHLGLDSRESAPSTDPLPGHDGLRLWLEAPRIQFVIRGDASNRAFVSAVKKACGLAPPVKANTVAGDKEGVLLWLGPDEWLYSQLETQLDLDLDAAFETALQGQHYLVSDVSSSRSVIGLAGAGARRLLMKATSLDVHPSVFAPGQCAQSAFARCHVLLHQLSDEPCYHLYVHRSFTDYTYRWLLDAAGLESPG